MRPKNANGSIRADTSKCRDLLGKLFHTDRYAFNERWLNDHSRTTQKNRDAARDDVLHLTARIHQAAGPDLKSQHSFSASIHRVATGRHEGRERRSAL
ncbi:hypothetical protein [Streptomyces sp. NPDC058440]|uniref:hypothetical protein n=1 Tax=unclassified Streptomyces TaxID=2593676 RepID=UPI00364F6FB1